MFLQGPCNTGRAENFFFRLLRRRFQNFLKRLEISNDNSNGCAKFLINSRPIILLVKLKVISKKGTFTVGHFVGYVISTVCTKTICVTKIIYGLIKIKIYLIFCINLCT